MPKYTKKSDTIDESRTVLAISLILVLYIIHNFFSYAKFRTALHLTKPIRAHILHTSCAYEHTEKARQICEPHIRPTFIKTSFCFVKFYLFHDFII